MYALEIENIQKDELTDRHRQQNNIHTDKQTHNWGREARLLVGF